MFDYENYKGFLDPEKDRSVLLSRHGNPLTAALFVERDAWKSVVDQRRADGKWDHSPIYSLTDGEPEGTLSAYRIYMGSVDEYQAALKLVGSLHHWRELLKKEWFLKELEIWREDMVLRDFSLAKKQLLSDVVHLKDGPAARHLLNFSHKVINPPSSKKKVQKKKKPEVDPDLDKLYNEHVVHESETATTS